LIENESERVVERCSEKVGRHFFSETGPFMARWSAKQSFAHVVLGEARKAGCMFRTSAYAEVDDVSSILFAFDVAELRDVVFAEIINIARVFSPFCAAIAWEHSSSRTRTELLGALSKMVESLSWNQSRSSPQSSRAPFCVGGALAVEEILSCLSCESVMSDAQCRSRLMFLVPSVINCPLAEHVSCSTFLHAIRICLHCATVASYYEAESFAARTALSKMCLTLSQLVCAANDSTQRTDNSHQTTSLSMRRTEYFEAVKANLQNGGVSGFIFPGEDAIDNRQESISSSVLEIGSENGDIQVEAYEACSCPAEAATLALLLFCAACCEPSVQIRTPERRMGLVLMVDLLRCCPQSVCTAIQDAFFDNIGFAIIQLLSWCPPSVDLTAAAFDAFFALLFRLGSNGRGILNAMLASVLPLYLQNVSDGFRRPSASQQEVALQAVATLIGDSNVLLMLYASFDCDVFSPVGLAELLKSLLGFEQERVASDASTASHALKKKAASLVTSVFEIVSDSEAGSRYSGVEVYPEATLKSVCRKQATRKLVRQQVDVINAQPKKVSVDRVRALLVEAGIIEKHVNNSEAGTAIAFFLHHAATLDKAAIGTVLGDPGPLAHETLNAFAEVFDFRGRSFVSALRAFLESFVLPGEAQKIERIMECFAKHYYVQNKDNQECEAYNSDSVVFVLSYSVIMLNTDLHNTSVQRKMTIDDFLRNNAGINDGNNISESVLRKIFNDISASEIKITGGMSKKDGPIVSNISWPTFVSAEAENALVVANPAVDVCREIFTVNWAAFLDAAYVILLQATDAEAAQHALEALLRIGNHAATLQLCEVIDALVVQLVEASGLAAGSLTDMVDAIGRDVIPQMATISLFGVVREWHNFIRRRGWQAVMLVLLRLHAAGMLDARFELLIGGNGAALSSDGVEHVFKTCIPVWWPSARARVERVVRSSSRDDAKERSTPDGSSDTMAGLVGLLFGARESHLDSDQAESDDTADEESQLMTAPEFVARRRPGAELSFRLLKRLIEDCRINDVLVKEVKFMSAEALESLLEVICWTFEVLTEDGRGTNREALLNAVLEGALEKAMEVLSAVGSSENHHSHRSKVKNTPVRRNRSSEQSSSSASATRFSEQDRLSLADLSACFFCDLTAEVGIQNKDRSSLVWPSCNSIVLKALSRTQKITPLIERAVVNLFKLGFRLFHREEVRDDLLRALTLLLQLPAGLFRKLTEVIAMGLHQMIRVHAADIRTSLGWSAVLALIETCAKYGDEDVLYTGLESLRIALAQDIPLFEIEKPLFALFLDAVHVYATASNEQGPVAVGLLACLGDRLIGFKHGDQDSNSNNGERSWSSHWGPLLSVFTQLCVLNHPETQQEAVRYLSVLLEGNTLDGSDASRRAWFDGAETAQLFRAYLFQILKKLLHRKVLPLDSVLKVAEMSCNVFIRDHRAVFRETGKTEWASLWLCLLQVLHLALEGIAKAELTEDVKTSASSKIYSNMNRLFRSATRSQILSEEDDPVLWRQTSSILELHTGIAPLM